MRQYSHDFSNDLSLWLTAFSNFVNTLQWKWKLLSAGTE